MFEDKYTQPSATPTRKVAAGTLAAAFVVILVWVLGFWFEVPAEVAAALTTLLGGLVAYFIPDRMQVQ